MKIFLKCQTWVKLRPAVAQVTWTRRDDKQDVVDYEHFTVPFILTVDEILAHPIMSVASTTQISKKHDRRRTEYP